MIPPDLRPLGIGEILDRAVTLVVRRFAVFALILAIVAVPIAILQYASSPASTAIFADLQRLIAVPPGHVAEQQAILREMSASNQIGAVGVFTLFAAGFFGVLSTTACMIGVAQAYGGALPSVREVYREALARWLPQLAAVVLLAVLGFVVSIVLMIILALTIFAVAALTAASKVVGAVVGIPVAIVAVLVFLFVFISMYFVVQMTIVSVALEEPNPIRGIANGIRRTLSPALFWRSMLVATIGFFVSLIGSVVLISVAVLASSLTHLTALTPVVTVIGGIALNALLTSFIVVYAVDVRVRREGYDLELAARGTAR